MSTIIINPADMTSVPDFNILNNNSVDSVGYSVEDTKYDYLNIGDAKEVKIFSQKDPNAQNSFGWLESISDSINKVTVLGSRFPNYYDYSNNIVDAMYNYYAFYYNVELPDNAKNIDLMEMNFKYTDDINFIYGNTNSPYNATYLDGFSSKVSEYPYTIDMYRDTEDTIEEIFEKYITRDNGGNILHINQGVKLPKVIIKINNDNTVTILNIELGAIGVVIDFDLSSQFAIYHTHSYQLSMELLAKTEDRKNENSETFIDTNELNQQNTKIDNVQISERIAENIKLAYSNDRQTATLSCYYCDYYDTDGNLVYDNKSGKTISVGDIVRPMIRRNGELVPMSTYIDGTPRDFEVVNSEINYGGKVINTIYLIETAFLYPTVLPTELTNVYSIRNGDKIYISGIRSDRHSVIYEFDCLNGNWELLLDLEATYTSYYSNYISGIQVKDNYLYFLEYSKLSKLNLNDTNDVSVVYNGSFDYNNSHALQSTDFVISGDYGYIVTGLYIYKINLATLGLDKRISTGFSVAGAVEISGNIYIVGRYNNGYVNIYSLVNDEISESVLKISTANDLSGITVKSKKSFECNFRGRIEEVEIGEDGVAKSYKFASGSEFYNEYSDILIIDKKRVRLLIGGGTALVGSQDIKVIKM